MKPKNTKERRDSILKFTLVFGVTLILVITAVFFDFNRLPFKENSILKERILQVKKEEAFQLKFSKGAEEINALLDSLDRPGQNVQYFNALINDKIVDLQKGIPAKDSTAYYSMYVNYVKSFVDIQELKGKLKSFENADVRLQEYSQEVERLGAELDKKNRYLRTLRR